MSEELSDSCIYTIAHGDKLAKAAASDRPTAFSEESAWITGHRLWREAEAAGVRLPVIFADATDCSQLLYWGILTDVAIKGKGTRYVVSRLRTIRGRHTPQELVLRRTGRTIAPRYIRPYAICRTPSFISG